VPTSDGEVSSYEDKLIRWVLWVGAQRVHLRGANLPVPFDAMSDDEKVIKQAIAETPEDMICWEPQA
jgi:hypothetical protein